MANETDNRDDLNLSDLDLKEFRKDLLAATCNQATMKLSMFQRGQRLNSHIYDPQRLPKIGTATTATRMPTSELSLATSNLKSAYNALGADMPTAYMPSEKVLNEIKLEKDLDMLKDVFILAHKELTEELDDEEEEDTAAADGADGDDKDDKTKIQKTGKRTGKYKNLIGVIEALSKDKNKAVQLDEELKQAKITLKEMKIQMESERQVAEKRLKEQDEHFAVVKHNLKNVTQVNNLEFDLVERWEENRFVQASIVCNKQEQAIQDKINELNERLAAEEKIMHEVQKYNELHFDELRERIVKWQIKYAEEMAIISAKIAEKEKQITDVLKVHERRREVCAEHTEFVRKCIEEKEAQRLLEEQQQRRIDSAICLQAWWRGVMVRKGFGPFRKKVKKGKKGKSKAKA